LEAVEPELAEAERLAGKAAAQGLVPEIHSERAALFLRDGRVDDARRQLEQARNLYREMGAAPNADRVTAHLDDLARR
jgi:hypothetical protein